MRALDSLPETATLIDHWAVILHDIGKPETFKIEERIRFDGHSEVSAEIAERILRRLHFSRRDIEHITWVIRHHFIMKQLLDMPIGKQRKWFLDPRFPTLMNLFYADAMGTVPASLHLYNQVKATYDDCLRRFPALPAPLLTGQEIMEALSLKPGPRVGEILNELLEKQLSHEVTTKESAREWLKQNF